LISWSFGLHIWSVLLGTEEADPCYWEDKIVQGGVAGWRQTPISIALTYPFWVESPTDTTQSLPKAWLGLSRHGAISTLASRRLEANLV